ncbi:RIKEN cDNA A230083G16 [Mus musculus]|uniref:Uncharacterized protein n=1 Tax=Mus musculus TaxID=10090 RepID=Q8CAE1_MOUSE|nr:RIKEN cDNA A230083G16 [Mus musculus]BAC30197.1 unnamed protein product [Mus musculus]
MRGGDNGKKMEIGSRGRTNEDGQKIFLKIKKGGWRGAALQGRGQTVGRQGEEPRSSLPGESCLHLRIPNRLAEERVILGIKPRALCMPVTHLTTLLSVQPAACLSAHSQPLQFVIRMSEPASSSCCLRSFLQAAAVHLTSGVFTTFTHDTAHG